MAQQRTSCLRRTGPILALIFSALGSGCTEMGTTVRSARVSSVGFYSLDWSAAGLQERLAARMDAETVELVACLNTPADDTEQPTPVTWIHAANPNGILPLPSSEENPGASRYGYSVEDGPLHLTVLTVSKPLAANSEGYLWLLKDLSSTRAPWKVVLMPRPVLPAGRAPADRTRLDLAELFQREHVTLVIATGRPHYSRSAPIGPWQEETVRYLVLGGDFPEEKPTPPPEWMARVVTEPYVCVMRVRANRLRWNAYDQNGRLVDSLELDREASHAGGSRFFTVGEILAGLQPEENADDNPATSE